MAELIRHHGFAAVAPHLQASLRERPKCKGAKKRAHTRIEAVLTVMNDCVVRDELTAEDLQQGHVSEVLPALLKSAAQCAIGNSLTGNHVALQLLKTLDDKLSCSSDDEPVLRLLGAGGPESLAGEELASLRAMWRIDGSGEALGDAPTCVPFRCLVRVIDCKSFQVVPARHHVVHRAVHIAVRIAMHILWYCVPCSRLACLYLHSSRALFSASG